MRGQLIALAAGVVLILSACAGINTFGTAARAGDTVALALGWNLTVNRQNATVQLTGTSGTFTAKPASTLRMDDTWRCMRTSAGDPPSRTSRWKFMSRLLDAAPRRQGYDSAG